MADRTHDLQGLIRERILARHRQLLDAGELLPKARLDACFARFRDRFGPDVLAALDGRALLETMHGHGNKDSLVYWLEFKDDEEFPAEFGSIAGGSALKFGLYRRKETGAWTVGSSREQREISEEEAIAIARRHRDQFLAGVRLLEQLPDGAGEEDYARLQQAMQEQAPEVAESAWGHKYFSLLFPTKLDDFHNPDYQRFHLIKELQPPPAAPGRYTAAHPFLALARQLDLPVNHLTGTFNALHGRPHRYWRVGTSDDMRAPRNQWKPMLAGRYVAIGWNELGDLSDLTPDQAAKNRLKELYAKRFPNIPQQVGKKTNEIFNFCLNITEGDYVIACDGMAVLGIGRVAGPYRHDEKAPFVHQRPVEWLDLEEWKYPIKEGLLTTVHELSDAQNLLAIERHLLERRAGPVKKKEDRFVKDGFQVPVFSGRISEIHQVLERKRQVILYGPPGTGKTYWAVRASRELAAGHAFGKGFDQLSQDQKDQILDPRGQKGLVRICSFHPAYGYEDFLEGWRPVGGNGDAPRFQLIDGVFKRLCTDAAGRNERFYLVIDEINRGDIPRIFGELLTLLEPDKRDRMKAVLPLSGAVFTVPANVYVIGTMNTADRSIALLDTALRRRFGFIELMPDASVLGTAAVEGIPLGAWMDAMNRKIREHLGADGRNLQIGHSYFMDPATQRPITDLNQFGRVLNEDVLPLLAEYFYGHFDKLEAVLGPQFVDRQNFRFREELFRAPDKLLQAVNALDPSISTSRAAVAAEADEVAAREEDAEEGPGEPDAAPPATGGDGASGANG